MTAEAVLQEMLLRYAAIESYQDRGVVLTTWPDKPQADEIIFTTFFRRPNRFRFEWTSHHPYPPLRHLKTHNLIWCDGTNVFFYRDQNGGVEPEASLIMAIAGATGISKGSALTVSNMLLPEIDAVSLADLQDLHLREDIFEETSCYCIRGRDLRSDYHELRIGVADYMLRSLSTTHENGATSDEIRREIQVDARIEEHIFQFQPALA
jgi:outer membrane lipoprotein-sorting protein